MVSCVDSVTYYLPCVRKTFTGGLNNFHSRMTLHYMGGGQYWRLTFYFLEGGHFKRQGFSLFIFGWGGGAYIFLV